jgi:hypothetical protein
LDLRWQRPDRPNGFYGLKDCIVMAKSGDPGYQPDWATWGAQDRTAMQKHAISAEKMAAVEAAAKQAQGAGRCPCSVPCAFGSCVTRRSTEEMAAAAGQAQGFGRPALYAIRPHCYLRIDEAWGLQM